jgi:hypothetical protein
MVMVGGTTVRKQALHMMMCTVSFEFGFEWRATVTAMVVVVVVVVCVVVVFNYHTIPHFVFVVFGCSEIISSFRVSI